MSDPRAELVTAVAAMANQNVHSLHTRHLRRCGVALAVHQGVTDVDQLIEAASQFRNPRRK